MMPGAITPAHVTAILQRLGTRSEAPSVIGIHSQAPWTGMTRVTFGADAYDVVSCRSELEIRERLLERSETDPPLVIVTPLLDTALAEDVLARIARRRLLSIDHWETLRELFRARQIDPRLARYPWIAASLAEHVGTAALPPAPGGVVTLEGVQDALLQRQLGFPTGRPDLTTLLSWSADAANLQRLAAAPVELQLSLPEWLESTAGKVARRVLSCAGQGNGGDAVAIGLVLAVVGPDETVGEIRLAQAAARLERFWGGGAIEPRESAAWSRAAEEAAIGQRERLGDGAIDVWLRRAEEILTEIGAARDAHRSRILPGGLEQRLTLLADSIGTALATPDKEADRETEARLRKVRKHVLAVSFPERVERAAMALRLVRWLRKPPAPAPSSLSVAMGQHAEEGAFVDWARAAISGGDANTALARTYQSLSDAVRERRSQTDRSFALALAEWLGTGSASESLLPIERVLTEVVAPVAQQTPVLLLVLDALSCSVLCELAEDLAARGWVVQRPERADATTDFRTALAAVPSVTEWSRATLLCGRRTQGGQSVERAGFAAHPDLIAASRQKKPPVLFHKADLGENLNGAELAVRDALATPEQRVVGIVINAVDDHLLKSDQVRVRWTIDTIRALDSILEVAATAGRAVIVTGDHGHVIEAGTELRRGSGSDRWRVDDGSVGTGEVVLRGPGATTAAGSSLIAAWAQDLRYGPKKNGYHGGAAPQEMVVPIGVFVAAGAALPGWVEAAMAYPDWWQAAEESPAPVENPIAAPPPVRRVKKSSGPQHELFAPRDDTVPAAGQPQSWIDALFASETFAAQEAALARGCPPRAEVRAVLEATAARGGKISRIALGRRLEVPEIRLQGKLAALRRLLNTDGYDVLGIDDASGFVELNLELLRTQFEI